jgi:hypothetical protein
VGSGEGAGVVSGVDAGSVAGGAALATMTCGPPLARSPDGGAPPVQAAAMSVIPIGSARAILDRRTAGSPNAA